MTRPLLMKAALAVVLIFAIALLPVGCGDGDATSVGDGGEVSVFAAASLADAVADLAEISPAPMRINNAGSGTLAQQIANGAPADALISANTDWMDFLEGRGRLEPGARVDLLRNRLSLITADESVEPISSLQQLTELEGRIAIGEPESVPAGQYAKQALQSAGVWSALQPRLVAAADVRAALAYVAEGQTRFGLVYATDAAAAADRTHVLLQAPADGHDPIMYPAALIEGAANPEAARRWLRWVQGPEAAAVFRDHGFEVIEPAESVGGQPAGGEPG